jgi:hypothetical protein
MENLALQSGGGLAVLREGTLAYNCLFARNRAGLRGGGALRTAEVGPTAWTAFDQCTFAGNFAGLRGAGLIAAESDVTLQLRDSIFWLNRCTLVSGQDAHLDLGGTNTIIEYCDVEGWTGDLGGPGNFDAYPLFVAGYYLSQTAAGPTADSPCVDAGPTRPVWLQSTRTDGVRDENPVDLGYHHKNPACFGDLDGDGHRDLADFSIFAAAYPSAAGDATFDPRADLDGDGFVDLSDFTILMTDLGQPCP